ncbi:MAG: DUF3570 domain-containing protein [Gammaproteobacteria bacterium]|nr:MAG: DUF3570 domain-containing protein [Gammaproteobacteria bacterium]
MSKKQSGISPALAALTSAAMALPGFSTVVKAAVGASEPKLSMQYTRYDEDSIPSGDSDPAAGERDRYEIDVLQVQFLYPLNEKWQLTTGFVYDDMSGSSPWYVRPTDIGNATGDPLVVMSGATIDDTRYDFRAGLDYFGDKYTISPSIAYSTEKDYKSIAGGVSVEYEFPNKATSVKGSISASFDEIEPTQLAGTLRVDSEDKENYTVTGSVTQVINKYTVLQSTLGVSYFDGFLTDPYKQVWIGVGGGFEIRPENRPGDRTKYTWATQLRRYSELLSAALHADYRFYYDDWDVRSHTLELGLNKVTESGWAFDTSIRYYSQTQADFYEPFYRQERADGEYSSDYRLSPYGAISLRLGLSESIGDWTVRIGAERYLSDKSYSFQKVDVENPALLDYTQFTFGMDYSF